MIKLLSYLRAFRKDEDASILVEFALLTPVLMFFVVGVADFSMFQNERMRLATAARAGAQYALADSTDTAVIEQVALAATDLDAAIVTVTVNTTFMCSEDEEVDDAHDGTYEYDDEDDNDHECEEDQTGYVTVTATEQFSTFMNYPWMDTPYTLTGMAKIRIY